MEDENELEEKNNENPESPNVTTPEEGDQSPDISNNDDSGNNDNNNPPDLNQNENGNGGENNEDNENKEDDKDPNEPGEPGEDDEEQKDPEDPPTDPNTPEEKDEDDSEPTDPDDEGDDPEKSDGDDESDGDDDEKGEGSEEPDDPNNPDNGNDGGDDNGDDGEEDEGEEGNEEDPDNPENPDNPEDPDKKEEGEGGEEDEGGDEDPDPDPDPNPDNPDNPNGGEEGDPDDDDDEDDTEGEGGGEGENTDPEPTIPEVKVDPSLFPDINVTPTGPEVNVDQDLIPDFGQEYVVDPERKREDWINKGQTRLINKRSTEFEIEEKSKEDIDQASNQDKLTVKPEVDEDGTYTIELSGKLSSMNKWTSSDSAHAEKPSPWYGIEFYFYDNPVKKVKFNGHDLEDSDIVDKEQHSIILWLDIDNLVNKPTTFTLASEEVTETFRISFTNLDVDVNIDPDKFPDIGVNPGPDINIGDNIDPGFGQDFEEDPVEKESRWVNQTQTRTLKQINTIFEVHENSPDGKSQSANQKKVVIQPVMDDGEYRIKLSGRLSGMSKWTSSDSYHNEKPLAWYGLELVFYENPVGKVKFDNQDLTEWDLFNENQNSTVLWIDLEDANTRDIYFTLEYNGVKETFKISFTNIDSLFPNPLVKAVHVTIHKNDDSELDVEETQTLHYTVRADDKSDYRESISIKQIIEDLSAEISSRDDDEEFYYAFDGLGLNKDDSDTLDDDYEIKEDIDLYVKWFKFNLTNDISITVHKNDGTETTKTLEFKDNTKLDEDDVTVKKIMESLSEDFKQRLDDDKNVYNLIGIADSPEAAEPLEEDCKFVNDKDLYLIWSTDAKASNFKITIHKNDGSNEKKEFVYIDYDYTKDDDLTINKAIDIIKEDPLDDTFMVREDDDIYEYSFKGLSFVPNGVSLPGYTRIVTDKDLYIVWDRKSKVNNIRIRVYKNDETEESEVLTFDDILDTPEDDVTVEKVLEALSEEFKYRTDVEDYGWEWIVLGLSDNPDDIETIMDLDTKISENATLYLMWDYVPDKNLLYINQIKIKKVIKKLNKKFYEELYDCSKIIKMFTENNSLYQIFDKVRTNDSHYAEMFADMYNKMVKVFSVLFYTVNISDIIAKNDNENLKCYPYEIAKWFLENNLSKADSLQNFVGIKQYFVKDVASKMFTQNFYDNYDRFLSLEHPVVDTIETGNINFPIEQVIFHFAENLFNFRELMRNTDFYWQEDHLTDDSYMNAYGLFLYCVINFMQLFYMESYLSDNKFQVRTQVKNIIKAFIPDCDGFVTYEDIVSFIKITT